MTFNVMLPNTYKWKGSNTPHSNICGWAHSELIEWTFWDLYWLPDRSGRMNAPVPLSDTLCSYRNLHFRSRNLQIIFSRLLFCLFTLKVNHHYNYKQINKHLSIRNKTIKYNLRKKKSKLATIAILSINNCNTYLWSYSTSYHSN